MDENNDKKEIDKKAEEPAFVHASDVKEGFPFEAVSLFGFAFFYCLALVSMIIYSTAAIYNDTYTENGLTTDEKLAQYAKTMSTWKPIVILSVVAGTLLLALAIFFHCHKKKASPKP